MVIEKRIAIKLKDNFAVFKYGSNSKKPYPYIIESICCYKIAQVELTTSRTNDMMLIP
jgi:hypothetical protein